jgi:acyl-CoA thioesterase
MATLRDVCMPRQIHGRYQLDIAPGWRQGRGAFGGLVVGALVNAIELQLADPGRKVRSVTAEIPAAVEHGTAEITVDSLRHGKNVSTLRAALSQHGEIRSHAVAILGAARAAAVAWNELRCPEAPPWTEVAPLDMRSPGPWPEFAQHFEYRIVEGVPMTGGVPRVVGWIRPRDPGPARGAAFIAAVIDAWFPSAFIRFSAWRPMATIAFTLDIVGDLAGLDPEAPLIYRATAPVCGDGYFLEARELWGADGRLVAINHQTFAISQ